MRLPGRTKNPILEGLRPFRSEDLEPLTRLLWETRTFPPASRPTPQDVILRWKRRNVDPAYDVQVMDGPAGNIMAFVQSGIFKDGTPRLGGEFAVRPEWRGQGIGSALLESVYERARRADINQITTPVYLLPGEELPASVQWLKRRGFATTHSYWQMRLDGLDRVPDVQWPQGFGVRTFNDREQDPYVWAGLIVKAFQESANAAGVLAQLNEPGVSPDGYFFAVDLATGREIGTTRARIDMQGGHEIGYIGTVGVLPEYRGRGVATSLMTQTLNYLRDRGMKSATLFVEDKNISARNLYDKLGWWYVYRTDHFWRRLTP